MSIFEGVILLSGVLAAAGCWFLYAILVQNGRVLLRLETMEEAVKLRSASPDGYLIGTAPLVRGFRVGNRFEADNIFGPVVVLDEYQIRDQSFQPGDVVVDIGAHIGAFSYLCHRQGSRAIYSYEPGERNFGILQQNLGRLPGLHLFQRAVWRSDCDPPPELLLSGAAGENTGSHSVLAAGQWVDFPHQQIAGSLDDARRVDAVPLDGILRGFEHVKLLKLDCEGSEFPILLTSRELDRVERIVAEVHEQAAELMERLDPRSRVPGYAEYRLEGLTQKLESFGYRVSTRRGDLHMHWFDARRV